MQSVHDALIHACTYATSTDVKPDFVSVYTQVCQVGGHIEVNGSDGESSYYLAPGVNRVEN